MTTQEHHHQLLDELTNHLKEVFDESNQAVYLYHTDTEKACNDAFAALLGYSSPTEWAAITDSFPEVFVAEESRDALISAFQTAVEEKGASTMPVTWRTKQGSPVETTVILVPISFDGHLFALHFVTKK